jgi:hypothetical protein
VYQGLDVVVFGPLKWYWTQERDAFETEKRQKVTKANFMSIYERAHHKAFTPKTICTAFRKTGVWPLNPNVVTSDMMAPSLETSSVGLLPLPQPSPVRVVAKVMHQYQRDSVSINEILPTDKDPLLSPVWASADSPILLTAAHKAMTELSATSAAFLVAETPVHSSHQLLAFIPTPLTPTHKRKHDLLDHNPESDKEWMYQEALRDAYR